MKIIGRQGIGFILVASEDELHRIAGRSPWTTESSGIRFAEGHVIAVGALFDRANRLQEIVPATLAAGGVPTCRSDGKPGPCDARERGRENLLERAA